MKKYIYIMLVMLTAGFTSCSNDDIPVEENVIMKTFNTTFKINPKTVIEPFTNEFNPGELQIFDENYQLRVRLLLYDQVGDYVIEDVQNFPNYMVTMESSKQLQAGTYKAIVITDLVKKTLSSSEGIPNEYWTLSDYKGLNLSKLKITDAGYTGGKNKILGVSYQNFTVDPNNNNEVKIDVKPAGAIIAWIYDYPHFFSNVKQVHLGTNKLVQEYIFNADGSYSDNAVVDDRYDNKRLFSYKTDVYEGENCNHYFASYCFVLPSRYNLKWMYSDTVEDFKDMKEVHETPMTLNIQAGEEWFVGINLKENIYYTPEKFVTSRGVKPNWYNNPVFIPEKFRVKNK